MKYICSFPKCGRTWLRYTLAQYCQLLYDTDLPIGFEYLGRVFIDFSGPEREEIYSKFPEVMFAHEHPFDGAIGSRRVILVRNFMDTMVSYHHHLSASGSIGNDIEQSIRDTLLAKWTDYMNAWVSARGETLWVKYADLKKVSEWERMLKFLSIAVDTTKIRQAMERSTFNKMLADEKRHPINKSTHQNHRRVRKGKVEGWKDEVGLGFGHSMIKAAKQRLTTEARKILEGLGVFKL